MISYIDAIIQNAPNKVVKVKETEIIIRCPYCGDSVKNPNHAHLYVSKYVLPGYNSPMFHCMRCGASGPVSKLLRKLGISKSKVDVTPVKSISEIRNRVDFYRKFKQSSKIDYVKMRLDVSEIPEWIDKTMVDSVSIQDNTLLSKIINEQYVGFKTYNSKRANFRCITPNPKMRYITLNKTPERDFYITYPKMPKFLKKGTLVVAEGVFSLLRGYLSLRKLSYFTSDNQIVLTASWSKKSLNTCVKYVVSYFGIFDWDIILLADKDLETYTVKFPCRILYNRRHDDFGEECNDIKEIIHKPKNNFLRRIV